MALTSITKDFVVRAGAIIKGTSAVFTTTGVAGSMEIDSGASVKKNLVVGSTASIYGPSLFFNNMDVDGIVTLNNSTNTTGDGTKDGALVLKNGGAYIDGKVYIANNTQATSASAGAFHVTGGIYTGDNILANGSGNSGDAAPALKLASGGALINKDVKIDGATAASAGGGALNVSAGGAYINKELWVDSTTNGSSGGGALYVKSGGAYINNKVYVNDNTEASTTGPAGALILANGGAYVKLKAIIDSSDDTTGTGTGALQVNSGGAFIKKNTWIDGTTDAATTPAGALVVAAGGAYIKKKAIVDSADNTTGAGTGALQVNSGGAYIKADLYVDGTTAVSTTSAALFVAQGGAYIDGDTLIYGSTAGGVGAGALKVAAGGINSFGDVYIDSVTDANIAAGGTGSLRTAGGAYVAKKLIVGSTAWDTSTYTSNALYVAGGAWIDESLHVGGPAVFNDTVWFKGTATYVFSTQTAYTDNIIELHVPPGGVDSAWVADDGKDIGLRFHYYSGSDKNAALVLANDTHYLEWYDAGAEGTNTFSGASYGTFKTGQIKLVATTSATNTGTGALTVEGGVGIAGDVWIGGVLHANSIVAPADISATVTTATNLKYGGLGQIPIQNGVGSTTFISSGTTDTILKWTGSTATWQSLGSITAGSASNIVGGDTYWIPFQDAPNVTAFDLDGTFAYNSATNAQSVGNARIYGDGAWNFSTADVSFASTATKSVELYSDTATSLNYNSSRYVKVDSSGITLDNGSSNTVTFNSSNELVLVGSTAAATSGGAGSLKISGGGYFSNNVYAVNEVDANDVNVRSLTATSVVFVGPAHDLTEDAQFTYDATNNRLVVDKITIAGLSGDGNTADVGINAASGESIELYSNDLVQLNFNNANFVAVDTNGVTVEAPHIALGVNENNPVVSFQGTLTNMIKFPQHGIGAPTNNAYSDGYKLILWDNVGAASTGYAIGVDTNTMWFGIDVAASHYFKWYANTDAIMTLSNTTLELGGVMQIDDSSASNAGTSTPAMKIAGGATVSKDLYVGTTATVVGQMFVSNATAVNNTSTNGSAVNSGAVQITGGLSVNKDLHVTTTATVGGDLYVGGNIYLDGVGLDTVYGTTGTFLNLISTGTIYANNITATNFTVTNVAILGSGDANISKYGYDLAGTTQALGVRGAIKTLGNLAVGKVGYFGMNDAGDIAGQNPHNKTINGVFIVNSMQAGGTYDSISGSSAQTIDSWDKTTYTSAKYIVQILDSGNIHTEELMVIQDGTNVYMSRYGIVTNNGELGEFDGSISGSNCVITFTPTSATAMTIQVVRQSILTGIENYC